MISKARVCGESGDRPGEQSYLVSLFRKQHWPNTAEPPVVVAMLRASNSVPTATGFSPHEALYLILACSHMVDTVQELR